MVYSKPVFYEWIWKNGIIVFYEIIINCLNFNIQSFTQKTGKPSFVGNEYKRTLNGIYEAMKATNRTYQRQTNVLPGSNEGISNVMC